MFKIKGKTMCGIFAYKGETMTWDELKPHADKISIVGRITPK